MRAFYSKKPTIDRVEYEEKMERKDRDSNRAMIEFYFTHKWSFAGCAGAEMENVH